MASQITSLQIKKFQEKILSWYQKNKRDLPWRGIPDDIPLDRKAYYILISEVMAQQTQIARVIPKYHAWLEKFPTIFDLAKANTREVLSLWSGLGYNRRALYLLACAEVVIKDHKGEFPRNEKELLQLPGIGRYTARALLCFAFGQQIAVVDTNVKKVLLLEFGEEIVIEDIADQVLPRRKAYDWNQALMDYSAIILKKEKHPQVQKQSRFYGSDRYYRGEIIRFLLSQSTTTKNQLQDHLFQLDQTLTKERLNTILAKMKKDKLIISSTTRIQLP